MTTTTKKHTINLINQANDPETKSETLTKLATHPNIVVRYLTAHHQNTTPETLHKLGTDKTTDVKAAVAENPNTPAETLTKLVQHRNPNIHTYAITNPNTPADILKTLNPIDEKTQTQIETVRKNRLQNYTNNSNEPTKTTAKLLTPTFTGWETT